MEFCFRRFRKKKTRILPFPFGDFRIPPPPKFSWRNSCDTKEQKLQESAQESEEFPSPEIPLHFFFCDRSEPSRLETIHPIVHAIAFSAGLEADSFILLPEKQHSRYGVKIQFITLGWECKRSMNYHAINVYELVNRKQYYSNQKTFN